MTTMVDLSTLMHDAARTGVQDRPGIAAQPVLHRIRRRRATRRAVGGTVGVAAAGAVAFGGVQLAGWRAAAPDRPADTAAPSPSGGALVPGIEVGCGTPVAELERLTGSPEVQVSAEFDHPATVSITLGADSGFDEDLTHSLRLVAVADGVVAGWKDLPDTSEVDGAEVVTGSDGGATITRPVSGGPLVCGPEDPGGDPDVPFSSGEYELYAVVQNLAAGGPTPPPTFVGGPWEIIVAGGEDTQGAAPSVDPVEPTAPPAFEDLVIGTQGLGPLLIGAPVPASPHPADVIRLDPTFCEGTDHPEQWGPAYPDRVGLDGLPWWPFTVVVVDERVVRVNVHHPGPRTTGGIQVGSTLAEVQAAHPDFRPLSMGAESGTPIEPWGIIDGETTLALEIAVNVPGDSYWAPEDLGKVVAISLVSGFPYDYTAWFAETCG